MSSKRGSYWFSRSRKERDKPLRGLPGLARDLRKTDLRKKALTKPVECILADAWIPKWKSLGKGALLASTCFQRHKVGLMARYALRRSGCPMREKIDGISSSVFPSCVLK
jgi:hypothetical protein